MAVPTARPGAEAPIPAAGSVGADDLANIVRHLDEPGMNKGPPQALLRYAGEHAKVWARRLRLGP